MSTDGTVVLKLCQQLQVAEIRKFCDGIEEKRYLVFYILCWIKPFIKDKRPSVLPRQNSSIVTILYYIVCPNVSTVIASKIATFFKAKWMSEVNYR